MGLYDLSDTDDDDEPAPKRARLQPGASPVSGRSHTSWVEILHKVMNVGELVKRMSAGAILHTLRSGTGAPSMALKEIHGRAVHCRYESRGHSDPLFLVT